jgi:hypothetical protein
MARDLATAVIARHQRRRRDRARQITIDLNPADDPTHSEQQLAFFDGQCEGSC